MEKKILIIGAGIAGLSAGCYGRMNGYDTAIFEMHSAPGGVCTGWVRKGYTFDGCLHWLTGSAPTSPLYRVWQELGAISGKNVTNHEAFCHVVTPSGRRFIQWGDLDRLFEELKTIGPEDAPLLDQMKADARILGSLKMPLGAPRRVGLLMRIPLKSAICSEIESHFPTQPIRSQRQCHGGSIRSTATSFLQHESVN